jgi:hypothetical protein
MPDLPFSNAKTQFSNARTPFSKARTQKFLKIEYSHISGKVYSL